MILKRIWDKKVCLLLFVASLTLELKAGNVTWNGVSSNWSVGAAWNTGTAPGMNDTAIFTGGGICTLNMNVTVAHFVFTAGFTGEFHQSNFSLTINPNNVTLLNSKGMILNSGTFVGSNNNFDITDIGIFTLNGATFTSTKGRLYVYRDFTSTGNFIHNNGWMVFYMNGSGVQNIKCVDPFFKVNFNTTSGIGNNSFNIDPTNDFIVLDTLSKTGVTHNSLNGADIHAKGDIIVDYQGLFGDGNVQVIIDGSGDQHLVGRAVNYYDGYLENPVISKDSGNLYIVNTIVNISNWTYVKGNIVPGTSKVYFAGSGLNLTITGTHTLYDVTFQGTLTQHRRYINSTDTLTVTHNLKFIGDNKADIYNGFIHAKGDITVVHFSSGDGTCGGNAYIVIDGDSDQTFQGCFTRKYGWLPNIIIDKPSGTLYMRDTINTERSWTYIRGNVDAVDTSYVTFVYQPNDPCASSGLSIDGEENGSYMLFDNIEIQQSRILNGDVHIKKQLVLNNNILVMNQHDIYLENPSNTAIQRGSSGYTMSETSSPPSSIHWFIDNSGTGTNYTFPFVAKIFTPACNFTPILFNLNVQTAGIPSGGSGWISVATYPTNPAPPANNRPFPPGVTNINNILAIDNSPRELDRYWVYNCGNYASSPQVSMTFRYLDQEWNTASNQITETKLRAHQWNGSSAWNTPNGTGATNAGTNVSTVSNITTCSAFTLVDSTLFLQLVFHATDTRLCVGDTVRFIDDNITQPSSRQWYFPGGTPSTSTVASPVVRYNNVGCYDAILWSTYPGGTIKDTFPCYIHVGDSFSIALTPTDISCKGDNNGSISVSVSQPGTYQYIWNDIPASTPNRTGLSPGEYHVSVVDTSVIGCDRVDSVTIIEPDSLTLIIDNVVDATCICDGRARANASGGTPIYTYQWDTSGTSQTSTTLCPGLRHVTVTDANGCSVSDTVSISGADPLIATIDSIKHVSCNGQCDGTAHAVATGGSGNYSYSWSCPNYVGPTAILLCGGQCIVTVTDISNACSVTATAVINKPDSLKVTLRIYPITSAGANDGIVKVVATGGTFPYIFSRNPVVGTSANAAQDSITNLPPGNICFGVTDAHLCYDTACTNLIEPLPPLTLTMGKTDVACAGVNNGEAWVDAEGGTGVYTYSWSGSSSVDSFANGLSPGLVTVTVTDAGTGDTITGSVTIGQPSGIPITYSLSVQIPSCNGSNDGKAWVSGVSGGIIPYSYLWDHGINVTNDTVIGLSAGVLYLTIEDSVGCKVNDTVTVSEPAAITISQTITPVTCPGGSNGGIDIDVSPPAGGGITYTYKWSTGVTTQDITGRTEGFYSVIVTNSVGCTATESYTIGVGTRFEISANVVNASCGNNDGTIAITILSGSGNYGYSWSNGLPPTAPAVSLVAGQYTVVVTDNGTSCTQTLTATVENSGGPIINGSVTNAGSCSSADGSISLTSPTASSTYAWSCSASTTSAITGLAQGSCTVTVTDTTSSCVSISTFDVGVINGLSLSAVVTDATCNSKNGAIDITVLSGSGNYTYTWSNGPTTADLTAIGFGTYGVTVNDNTGCSGDSLFVVNEGGPPISETVTDVSCFGKKDGAISITVTGTNTFSWSTGAVSQNISGLGPGTYSVTVNSNTQCSSAKIFVVDEPDPFTVTADRSGISCFGADDGWINLTVTGGNFPYTYNWSGPSFTSIQKDINALAPGMYNVTATDSKTCASTLSSVEITEPDAMVLTIDTVRVSCGGAADGQASVTVVGGVPDYEYLWNRGTPNDSSTVLGLDTGMISVTVTDANTCTASASSVINQQPPLDITLSKTDISCFGLTDGQATVVASGGTPGYHYSWSKGTPQLPDSSVVLGLDSGYVSVTVTDSKTCTTSDSIRIIEPTLLTTTIVADSVDCFGDTTGGATVTPLGGTQPYTYTWNPALSTGNIIAGLAAGDVYVTVTDSHSCVALDTVTVYEPTALVLVMDSTNNICPGTAIGTATVTVSGGTPNYGYSWSPVGQPGGPNIRIQLPAGPVSVTVNDAHNCQATAGVNISEPPPIVMTLSQTDIACFGDTNGVARLTSVTGGTPYSGASPYNYSWSHGASPLNLDSVQGLWAGNVSITVTDSLGCTKDSFVNIIEPTEIVLVMDSINISCFGFTDGQASVTASGGTPGPGYTYSWNTGSDFTPVITTQRAGVKSVTVTDSRSCTNSDSINVAEPTEIVITSITQTDVACFGAATGTAQVVASGGTPSQVGAAGYTYSWSSGTSITPGDKVENLSAGIVSVRVMDSRACPKDTFVVITQPLDSISLVMSATDVLCFGGTSGTATVVATGGTPGYTYSWTKGVPGNTSTTTQLDAGLVSVVVTDSNLCAKTKSITLTQPAELILTMTVDSNTNCYGGTTGGLTVNLTGGTPNYSYSWSTNPPQELLNTSQTFHGVAGLGVGSYTVSVTDSNLCMKQADTTIIERSGPQIDTVTGIVRYRPTCERDDGSIKLLVTTEDPGLTYVWDPSSLGTSDSVSGLAEGTYRVTITDGSDCDESLTIELLDIPGPIIDSFFIIKHSYCDDYDGQATAIISGGTIPYHFSWIDNNNVEFSTDSVVKGLDPGNYSVIIKDDKGCPWDTFFTINNIASPNAQIFPVSPQTIYVGQVVNLTATSDIPNSSFNWNPTKGLSCSNTTCDTLTATPVETVTYTLIVSDASTGCNDTTYITVIVKDEKNIFVPNVITPNGDGVNDTWNISDLLEVFPENEVAIVNRWGDEVFRTKNYGSTNNNKWDGFYKGEKLPDGTYYYIIKLNNIGKSVSGPVTIISE